MSPAEPSRPRRQADDWVLAGLRVLAAGSITDVKVERLAADLGVTKGSFYWHFEDRAALLRAMRDRWVAQDTDGVIEMVDAASGPDDPVTAIERLFAVVFGPSAGFDGIEAAIREWSATDPEVAEVCRAVDARRVAYVADRLEAGGVDPELARGRAEVLYRVVIGEYIWRRYGGSPLDPEWAIDVVRQLSRGR